MFLATELSILSMVCEPYDPCDDLDNDDGPCWDGYEMIGMKTDDDGNEVPNCVPEDD